MSWQRLTLCIPVELTETGNRLAYVLDPDTGGHETFGKVLASETGKAPATHTLASTLIRPEYVQALSDPETMHAALLPLAESREREAPTLAECEAFHAGAVTGEDLRLSDLGLARVEKQS